MSGPSRRSKIIRDIAGSWLGLGADAITGVLLTRIILHSVGDASFGLWVVMSGLLGYYGLLDLGTRNAIIRYVARYDAQKDFDKLSKVVSTALATYVVVGAVALLIAGVVAWRLNDIFTFQNPNDLLDARKLVLILGVGAAISFPMNAFGGTLEGLQHFVWIGSVQATASVLRAITVFIFLRLGYGIVAVGLITVVFNVVAGGVNAAFVLNRLSHVRFVLAGIHRETLVTLAGFGVVTFWIGVSNRLRFESDALVIGNMLGLQLVAIFAIASKIIAYSTEVVGAMSGVFTPRLSHADAVGDRALLSNMTLTGNYYASLLSFPIALALVVFGKDFIQLWVGSDYLSSYTVLVILAFPTALYASQGATMRMMYGIGKHKPLAIALLCEGAVNIGLSIALARRYGIVGVAWGTAIPLMVTGLVVLPWFARQSLQISIATYWRSAQLPALTMLSPVVLLFFLVSAVYPRPPVAIAAVEFAVGAALYGLIVMRRVRMARGLAAR